MAFVNYELFGHVGVITLNRPERMNALSPDLQADLRAAQQQLMDDGDARVAVYTGAGDRAFCAGMDMKEAATRSESDGPRRPGMGGGPEVTKPTIAALNGAAFGGGMEMALGCDVRICSPNATMALSEVKRGLTPINGLYDLPRIIGTGPSMWWMLSGETISAEEAYRLGIVTRIVPLEDLVPTAIKMGKAIAANSPLVVRTVRHILRNLADLPKGTAKAPGQPLVDEVWNSPDSREGIRAFAEKRAPDWPSARS